MHWRFLREISILECLIIRSNPIPKWHETFVLLQYIYIYTWWHVYIYIYILWQSHCARYILAYIYYSRSIAADILRQTYDGRCIGADILRQISDGRYMTADVLPQIHCSRFHGRYIMAYIYITADMLRQTYYGKHVREDVLHHIYFVFCVLFILLVLFCGRYISAIHYLQYSWSWISTLALRQSKNIPELYPKRVGCVWTQDWGLGTQLYFLFIYVYTHMFRKPKD